MKYILFAFFVISLTAAQALHAFQTESISNKTIFSIEFPDGTSYTGQSIEVLGISKQKYLIAGFEICEITIDMAASPTQIRIYNMRPLHLDDLTNELDKRTPNELKNINIGNISKSAENYMSTAGTKIYDSTYLDRVAKTYPYTTHSKTLEFIVPNLEELEQLYKALNSDMKLIPTIEQKKAVPTGKNPIGLGGKLYKLTMPK